MAPTCGECLLRAVGAGRAQGGRRPLRRVPSPGGTAAKLPSACRCIIRACSSSRSYFLDRPDDEAPENHRLSSAPSGDAPRAASKSFAGHIAGGGSRKGEAAAVLSMA